MSLTRGTVHFMIVFLYIYFYGAKECFFHAFLDILQRFFPIYILQMQIYVNRIFKIHAVKWGIFVIQLKTKSEAPA